jgi:hypothetical protein
MSVTPGHITFLCKKNLIAFLWFQFFSSCGISLERFKLLTEALNTKKKRKNEALLSWLH